MRLLAFDALKKPENDTTLFSSLAVTNPAANLEWEVHWDPER